jgi:hypothetical protein
MHRRPTRSYALIALSLIMGFGLALVATSIASAKKARTRKAAQIPVESFQLSPLQEDTSPASPTPLSRYYVSKSGDGTDGISWTTAFTQVQQALDIAISGDEIWVASGVYTPGTYITESFRLVPGTALYGGFAGGETELAQRDWTANPTVLSGDIGGDDLTDGNGVVTDTGNIVGHNSYHVVHAFGFGTPFTSTTVLDGFSITGGQADGGSPANDGGGLYCYGQGTECSPSLSNLTFSGNLADYGGAIYNDGAGGISSPSLEKVTFSGNSAVFNGGAIYNFGFIGISSPSLVDVTFSGNSAGTTGGAMYNYGYSNGVSSPSLVDVTFSGNQADYGGAIANFGYSNGVSSPSLLNVTLSGNQANNGGAIHNYGFSGASSPGLVNVILWNNTAAVSGKEMYNDNATPVITTSLVQGGIAGAGIFNENSSVTDGGGNIGGVPLFERNPDPGDGDWTTLADNDYGDLRLRSGSPAIDAGTNLPGLPPTDLAGNPRIINGVVDMGAYEAPPPIIYVNHSAPGSQTGLDWGNAFNDLQDALAWAVSGTQIWVATGVYTPGATTSDSFNLGPGVKVIGGFAGDETLLGQRDWAANPTVLSGDIEGDDVTDANGVVTNTGNIVGDNSYHVVFADGASGTPITGTTVLNGFSITGGQADGTDPNDKGGGFYCAGSGSGNECSPSLIHVTFAGNHANYLGGAIFNHASNGKSSPSLVDVNFLGNSANYGGAMYNNGYQGESSPSLVDVNFSGNSANHGGAMYNGGEHGNSSPSLVDVIFSGNSAGTEGGAMQNVGYYGDSSPSLLNVTFSGNSAVNTGGAILNFGIGGTSSPSLVNVILWNDSSDGSGDEMYNNNATPVITTSLVQGGITGAGIINDNSVLTDGGGNIEGDPLFVRDPDPGDGSWTTWADNDYGDLRLKNGSPAIDAGTNLPGLPPTDLAGNPRIINGVVDMGAYEALLEIYLPLVMK